MALAGTPGSVAIVEASADFRHWDVAGQVTLSDGTGLFQELAREAAARFFRIQP
jgi:hypothetical protein